MWVWLSSFLLNPAMAIGSAAVASPILIHLLSRRRFRRIRWAAMSFLLEAQKKNRRRVRIEQLILLALRCLALLLLAFVMMRPFLSAGALGALSATARSERIFLLDDSFSMGYVSPTPSAAGQSVFRRATDSVETIARLASEQNPDDTLTLITTSKPREPILALPSLSEANLRRLTDLLSVQSPTQSAGKLSDAIAALGEMLRTGPPQANRIVYVISDFQRRDWLKDGKPVGPEASGVFAPLLGLEDHQGSLRFVLVDAAIDPVPANIALTNIRGLQPQSVAGVPTRFELTIANYSERALQSVELSLRVGDRTLPSLTIPTLGGGQIAREPIEVTFPEDGSTFVEAKLVGGVGASDGVSLDNVRTCPVEVVSAIKAIVVDGEPSGDPYRDEVYLLRTALRPDGRAASGIELDVLDEQELEAADLNSYAVVLLANVGRLRESVVRSLEEFVRAGGGLVIMAGSQVDLNSYNETLFANGQGLLPMRLVDIAESTPSARPVTIQDWDVAHPVMRSFVDELAAVLRQVHVASFVRLADQPAATSSPAEPAAGRAGPRVLVRLNDPDQTPLIVEREFGRGKCLWIGTTADQDWNDWAASFSYLPMMLEMVQYVSRPAQIAPQSVVGRSLVCEIDPAAMRPDAMLRTPGYPVEPEVALAAVVSENGAQFRFDDTRQCGLYQFELKTTRGDTRRRLAAVNPDGSESDLSRTTQRELAAVLGDLPFEYVGDTSRVVGDFAAARTEVWWPLLITVIVLFMSEHALAWWFGTRG
ncbi:MAG: BatA domain-containing protein [Planctomycetia bacterium]|jgi:hypothetical protein|nr:BatA domain-containing protein [Planctomycetia bacterium]MCC7316090.1 BatA domain-containing protein [Planctomycetota bacterium]OQY96802.1 MAG: hypothetical protein B6D36_19240 [Planctomycetes bacterium UTPLA1]